MISAMSHFQGHFPFFVCLRYLTKLPHSPGSERNKQLGLDLLKKWEEQGFDKAESFKYNIYLSNPKAPGEISIWNGSALEKKLVINPEPPYDKSEMDGTVLYPFNAFSAAGSATVSIFLLVLQNKLRLKKLRRCLEKSWTIFIFFIYLFLYYFHYRVNWSMGIMAEIQISKL